MAPPTNPRKRPAPGSSPAVQPPEMAQRFGGPDDQYLRWGQDEEDQKFTDPSQYPMNNAMSMQAFGGNNNIQTAQYTPSVQTSGTQIARRPMSRQLVTAPRTEYDNANDTWGPFGESTAEPQNSDGMEDHDSVERLEERAILAKRDASSKRKQIPPFVQKLSSFLDKSENTDLIRWSDQGDSFIVLDEDEFAKTLIPELFKHNNYASFVRQLNMYGFHKRVGLSDNSMKASERKNKSPSEYYNSYFRRGHPNLLWLINKPKGGSGTKKGKGRQKTEDGGEGSDEDGQDGVEETYGYGQAPGQGQRAISAAPEAGPLQKREMALVQNQLQEIQKQQSAISNAISRLRKDHNQLYQQAVAFQTLHDRHESSINAILTFLATVYNRSLDGQNGPNIAQMFTNAIPQDQQQRNVVDMSDMTGQQQQQQPHPGSLSPHRRVQRLLMAPPAQGSNAAPDSSIQTQMAQNHYQHPISHPAIEELFENSPAESPQIKNELDQLPNQQNMMNIINNTNAQSRRPGSNGMAFPDALSHFETANGNSPLTTAQRQDMLQLIANTSTSGSNNALVSPSPPMQPSLEDLGYTQAEIEELARMQREQQAKIQGVSNLLQPLSPSGSIPGLNDQYFADATIPSPSASQNLDLDQFLDSSAYYPNGDGDFNYDSYNSNIPDASNFDFGLDGANDGLPGPEEGGRIIETPGSSPSGTTDNAQPILSPVSNGGRRSPNKRRKKA